MKTGIGKWLQIDTGNRPMIAALLVQAGATGLFAGMLEVVATALFLESHSTGQIPLAIMVSGAVRILLATVYSYFSKQLEIRSFGILNLTAALVTTLLVFAAYHTMAAGRFDFLLFVLMGPMLLITLLGFWITVRGFLSPQKGRQLSGLVEASLVGGMVLGSVLTPVLVMNGVKTGHVLYPGFAGLVVATGAQLYLLLKMERKKAYPQRRVSSTGPVRLFSHRYTGMIAGFAALGVSVWVVIHYAFLWSASDRFRGGADLVAFLGFFLGAMVFTIALSHCSA